MKKSVTKTIYRSLCTTALILFILNYGLIALQFIFGTNKLGIFSFNYLISGFFTQLLVFCLIISLSTTTETISLRKTLLSKISIFLAITSLLGSTTQIVNRVVDVSICSQFPIYRSRMDINSPEKKYIMVKGGLFIKKASYPDIEISSTEKNQLDQCTEK